MKRFRDLGLAVAVVALLAAMSGTPETPSPREAAVDPVAFSVSATRSLRIPTGPRGQFTIAGVAPGMTRGEVDALLTCLREDSPGNCEYGMGTTVGPRVWAYVHFDTSRRVTDISGDSLEFEGETIWNRPPSPQAVRDLLGPPDLVGWGGVGMCEGPFGSYGYRSSGLEVSFSQTFSNVFSLRGPSRPWDLGTHLDEDYPEGFTLPIYFERFHGDATLAEAKPEE